MERPKIIDVYGFFGTIAGYWGRNEYTYPPWANTPFNEVTYDKIDKLFFTLYGDRPISRYVAEYLKLYPDFETSTQQIISDYVLDMFRDKWARLVADYTAEYNPVENYSMVETEVGNESTTGTDTVTDSYTNYKETQKYGHTVTTDTSADVYGYNSSDAVPSDTGNSTTTFGDAGDAGDELSITGTKANTTVYAHGVSKGRELHRSGNIGVKTATEMLESDVSFWNSHNFWNLIVADMASILTIPIYE